MTPSEYVREQILKWQAEVDGKMVAGISVSFLISTMRGDGYKNVTEDSIERLGSVKVVDGKVGKWTKGGYQYCQPARIFVLK